MLHLTVPTESVFPASIMWNKVSQQEGALNNSSLSEAPCMLDGIAAAETKVGRTEASQTINPQTVLNCSGAEQPDLFPFNMDNNNLLG